MGYLWVSAIYMSRSHSSVANPKIWGGQNVWF